ncbi:hypothetical protein N3K66_000015 [Trichothecium roseum]|uniref:Uncharacterized protein n=1 Tax=Trichothecium roseum TaxID=47278 RepID=A0ACC0VC83_9HYPO|nr:hypothetical protein N3K66_000015 [Trichothecium roseum]
MMSNMTVSPLLPSSQAVYPPTPSTTATTTLLLPQHWPSAAAALVLLVTLLAAHVFKPDPLSEIPLVGTGSAAERRRQYVSGKATELYIEGYQKFKNGVFRIVAARPARTVVVSPAYLDELRKLPDTVLSFTKAVKETMQTEYLPVKIDDDAHDIIDTIRSKLTPALPRLTTLLADEIKSSLDEQLPPLASANEWTQVNLAPQILRTVAASSGRVFIGPELCRDPRYLDSATNFPADVARAVVKVTSLPGWLRPLRARSLPEVRRLEERMAEADDTLRPVVTARRERRGKEGGKEGDGDDNMLQWIMDVREKEGRRDDKQLANDQVNLSFAAIHTTAGPTTRAAYWLAAMPEVAPELRQDVRDALAASGGAYTTPALQGMKKLDSFLKEVLRCSPTTLAAFERMVLQTMTLSTGQTIPAGTVLEVPLAAVCADPAIFPSPHTFDPLRHHRLRLQKQRCGAEATGSATGSAAQQQLVSVGPASLSFGFGRHACPGRFFAANQVKIIIAELLLGYDLKLAGDVEFDGTTRTDPSKSGARILMRRISE